MTVQKHTWRTDRPHRIPFNFKKGEQPTRKDIIPATRFFDQLSFIGNAWVGCFVLETSDGLIQIDAMEPKDMYVEMIEQGYKDLGLDIHELRAVLLTHGHFDHYGRADYFRERYGAKLYMSRTDEDMALGKTGFVSKMGPMPFEMDGYLEDGAPFVLGDTAIQVFSTPGHSPGCMSFILPVTDEGRPHKVSLWGGTGVPMDPAACRQYLDSSRYFAGMLLKNGVDGEISNHPFIDNSPERLALVRGIVNGVANPYVIGTAAVLRYQDMFTDMCLAAMASRG